MKTAFENKGIRLFLALAYAGAVFVLVGCQSKERKPEESPKTVETPPGVPTGQPAEEAKPPMPQADVEAAIQEERNQLVRDAQARLDALDRNIADLEARMNRAEARVQQESREALAELKEQRRKTAEQLDKAKAATRETWSDMKRETQNALDRLESSYNSILDKMKTEQ